ncbi:MAG: precorrin-6y C5,15-methyltransferase (decarboxylating) subunit CbiE [Gemmobacter sp.]
MSGAWLSLVGIGEDGLAGLSEAARAALEGAEVVFGGARHLALAGVEGARARVWPVPFDAGGVLACRGRRVAVLVSGDPFWHGAGGSLMPHLAAGEWVAHPAVSTFQWAAGRLGWRLEEVSCLGLHAAPFARLVPVLGRGVPVIALVRDGAAVQVLADWLCANGFADARLWVMEALGGPRERVREVAAAGFDLAEVAAPVAVAITTEAPGLSRAGGLPDAAFAHDGQITKAPIRALTLAALAPRPGDLLWDLGAGSGSVSVGFCLAGGRAVCVEARSDRAANIRANAARFGLEHRMTVVEGRALEALGGLPAPDAVFVGGGCDAALLTRLWEGLAAGTRLVVNAVTIETEALLAGWQARQGGTLMRIDIAMAAPLGTMRGWSAARPVVQWSVVR